MRVLLPALLAAPAAGQSSLGGAVLTTSAAKSSYERFNDFMNALTTTEGPSTIAVHSSGGAAGGVVSEGQGYGVLVGGITAAAMKVKGETANYDDVVDKTYQMFKGWQKMCELSTSSTCQTGGPAGTGHTCQKGGSGYACLPHWKVNDALSSALETGPAPDGDEDMLKGLVMLLLATEAEGKSWWNEAADWAYETCENFYHYETTGDSGSARIVKLGTCWGGWDCQNPSYHDPAMFRLCRNWMKKHDSSAYASGGWEAKWNELVQVTYKVLYASQCSTTGLVPNWYKPDGCEGNNLGTKVEPSSCQGTTGCSGSGTPADQYGSEAARTTWRVVIDYMWFGEETAATGGPALPFGPKEYLRRVAEHTKSKMEAGWSDLDTCGLVGSIHSNWQGLAFLYGPTVCSLVADLPQKTWGTADLAAAADKLNGESISGYYAGSWAVISTMTINGDFPSLAGWATCMGGCDNGVDDCAGVTCGGHGTCVDTGAAHVCQCDAPYGPSSGAADACTVQDTDDCAGVSCCHGACVDGWLSYTCQCDSGYEAGAVNSDGVAVCDTVPADCDTVFTDGSQDCRGAPDCCAAGMECLKKDQWWGACQSSCQSGWDCTVLGSAGGGGASTTSSVVDCPGGGSTPSTPTDYPTDDPTKFPTTKAPASPQAPQPPPQNVAWDGENMVSTHYWDCNGQGCDSATLSPWNPRKYWSSAGYAPQDPNWHGGPSQYGEQLWVTGAASDGLSSLLGSDDGCCGSSTSWDGGVGGCGKCVLIENSQAVNSHWRAIAMKKNRCPPGACNTGMPPHFDIAAPGFDVSQYSFANECGMDSKDEGAGCWDYQSSGRDLDHASYALGQWYLEGVNSIQDVIGKCDLLPGIFQAGCRLFASWGWTNGKPEDVKYKVVPCPAAFTAHIQSVFGTGGPTTDCSSPVAPPPAPATPTKYPTSQAPTPSTPVTTPTDYPTGDPTKFPTTMPPTPPTGGEYCANGRQHDWGHSGTTMTQCLEADTWSAFCENSHWGEECKAYCCITTGHPSGSGGCTCAPVNPQPGPHETDPPTKFPVSDAPTQFPATQIPTDYPTGDPTKFPITNPTNYPTATAPTDYPTAPAPTDYPTPPPTNYPTAPAPTDYPTDFPTIDPTKFPATGSPVPAGTTSKLPLGECATRPGEWGGCQMYIDEYENGCCAAGLHCFLSTIHYAQCKATCPTNEGQVWACDSVAAGGAGCGSGCARRHACNMGGGAGDCWSELCEEEAECGGHLAAAREDAAAGMSPGLAGALGAGVMAAACGAAGLFIHARRRGAASGGDDGDEKELTVGVGGAPGGAVSMNIAKGNQQFASYEDRADDTASPAKKGQYKKAKGEHTGGTDI